MAKAVFFVSNDQLAADGILLLASIVLNVITHNICDLFWLA